MKTLEGYFKEKNIIHLLDIFLESGIDEPELLARVKYTDLQQMNIKTFEERRKVFEIINEINSEREDSGIEICRKNLCSKELKFKGNSNVNLFLSGVKSSFSDTSTNKNTKDNYIPYRDNSETNRNVKISNGSFLEISSGNNSCNNSFSMDNTSFNNSFRLNTSVNSSLNSSKISFPKRNKTLKDNGLDNSVIGENSKIFVCVRKRPTLANDIVDVRNNTLTVNEPKVKLNLEKYVEKHIFNFDYVFTENDNNNNIYNKAVKDIVDGVLKGNNGSLIAYGQTGTGKTHTMFERDGMVPRAIEEIKRGKISFFEIYISTVMDLLNFREVVQMREKDGKVIIKDLVEKEFNNFEEGIKIIEDGIKLRKTGVTGANQKSSRSHAVLQIKGNGMLTIVDLAGNERGSDRIVNNSTCSTTKAEGSAINKSLLVLKECIRGIDMKSKYLPFRQSKLTQILKSAFMGESNTLIIATISPDRKNVEHTLNTLRYAYRIKDVKKDDIKEEENIFNKSEEIRILKNKIETTVSRLMISVEECEDIDNLNVIHKKLLRIKKEVEENKMN